MSIGKKVGPSVFGLVLVSACSLGPTTSATSEDAVVGSTAEALTTAATFRRGGAGLVADTFISASEMQKSFGDRDKLRVSAKNEALLRFDLASIPASAVINSATLTLYLNGGDDETDDDCADGEREGFPVVPIKIHRATAPWNEGAATYASFGQQFDAAVAGTILPTSANVFKSVDLKSLVQRWVSGDSPNDGIVIGTTAKRHTIFVSSEGGKLALRPALSVTYTTPDDHCVAQPCQHGGVCQNTVTGFTCACAPGYTGATCATPVDNCASQPCQNGGSCTSAVDAYTCACAPGYAGTNCQTNIDDCAGNPCQNGGVCTDGVNSHACACAPGYTGANCQSVIDNCGSSPCQNGGTCANGANTFTCSCLPGFTGATCASLVDNCAISPCQNGGTCADAVNSYTCNCAPGYAGPTCASLIDNCASGPCQNGGSCANGVGSYVCACPAGYSGANCEIDINDCAPNPCANGAACVDGVNSFTCVCPSGFTGPTCATKLGWDWVQIPRNITIQSADWATFRPDCGVVLFNGSAVDVVVNNDFRYTATPPSSIAITCTAFYPGDQTFPSVRYSVTVAFPNPVP